MLCRRHKKSSSFRFWALHSCRMSSPSISSHGVTPSLSSSLSTCDVSAQVKLPEHGAGHRAASREKRRSVPACTHTASATLQRSHAHAGLSHPGANPKPTLAGPGSGGASMGHPPPPPLRRSSCSQPQARGHRGLSPCQTANAPPPREFTTHKPPPSVPLPP